MPSASDFWLNRLPPSEAAEILGPRAREIVALVERERAGQGEAGQAVEVFMDGLSAIPWGRQAGTVPLEWPGACPLGREDAWVAADKMLAGPSQVAGIAAADLFHVWNRVGVAVGPAGGHLAANLAGGAAAELALTARGGDLHYFLELMPWARRGHWPVGLDPVSGLVLVY